MIIFDKALSDGQPQ